MWIALLMVSMHALTRKIFQKFGEHYTATLKQAPRLRKMGIKIIGQIVFWDTAENLMRISETAELRAKFAASVMDVMEQLQLDGILFQWMWPGCPRVSHAIFATLLRATQQKFDSKLESSSIALSITTHTNFFSHF
jgi:GH18 family chitinase